MKNFLKDMIGLAQSKNFRGEGFYGRDLFNVQVLLTNRGAPTEEQFKSIKNLLGFFSTFNYNKAILRSRGDQYMMKLKNNYWHEPHIRNFIDHVEKEYKEID